MVELKVRLGPKGQIVIPKTFRDYYKIYPLQEVIIASKEEGVLIKKQDSNIIEKLREMALEASKGRKGKKFRYNSKQFYEQYEKRTRKAGIGV